MMALMITTTTTVPRVASRNFGAGNRTAGGVSVALYRLLYRLIDSRSDGVQGTTLHDYFKLRRIHP
jgi:hypothetical protein